MLRLANWVLKVANRANYLGVMETDEGVTAENCMRRTQSAIQRTHLLRAAGIHERKIPSKTMLTIRQMFVQTLATYAIHIKSESKELQKSWDKQENEIVKIALGIIGREER